MKNKSMPNDFETGLIYSRLSEIPVFARVLTNDYDGYIVGGSALYLTGKSNDKPRDWDIIIEPSVWPKLLRNIPKETKLNSFGGFKLDNVDFWPEDVGSFFRNVNKNRDSAHAIHVKSQTVLKLEPVNMIRVS